MNPITTLGSRILCYIILMAGASYKLTAQNAHLYTFSEQVGSYMPVAGGTVLDSATDVNGSGALENGYYPVTLPFSFTLAQQTYTSVVITANGSIGFGGYFATAPNVLSDNSETAKAIAGFNNHLSGTCHTTGIATAGSNIITGIPNTSFFQVGQYVSAYYLSGSVSAITDSSVTLTGTAISSGAVSLAVIAGKISTQTTGVAPDRVFTIQWSGRRF